MITSLVISGKASLRPMGPIALPGRFRFTHIVGQDYRHYIECTFYGLPIMMVNERFVDGHGRMELPFGTDEGPKYDQAANLGMWSELSWFPSVFLTDPRVSWQALDNESAVLVVPFENTQEHYVVRFDPQTGLISWFESMRYKSSQDESKTLWLNQNVKWGTLNGRPFSLSGAAIWMDDGKPWATFTVEDVVYNADVADYLRSKGL